MPETTLFLIASKTFTTIETMTNARTARKWIAEKLGEAAVGDHFAAISTAIDKVKAFGISEDRIFGFWDWVGGRYSIWSAIGLPLMIAIGPRISRRFLDGGHAMDQHFREAPVCENLPMLMGLIGVWHRNICGYPSRAIIPYDQRLSRFPAYLQQLDMESNGKRVTKDGAPSKGSTGPIVWGEPGTNGQHAFFQLLHQGTDIIPVEFLIAAEPHETGMAEHHALLIANCLAQSQALMKGRTLKEAEAQLLAMGKSKAEAKALAPHRVFTGNRPSMTLAYRKLDPYTLGRLIALYEHRVFVEAAIWDINAFDQWGVELGKELATGLQPVVEGKKGTEGLDSSTAGLVDYLRGSALEHRLVQLHHGCRAGHDHRVQRCRLRQDSLHEEAGGGELGAVEFVIAVRQRDLRRARPEIGQRGEREEAHVVDGGGADLLGVCCGALADGLRCISSRSRAAASGATNSSAGLRPQRR